MKLRTLNGEANAI